MSMKKTPRLNAQVFDLLSCINLAHAFLVSGEGKAVRQCKHCGKFLSRRICVRNTVLPAVGVLITQNDQKEGEGAETAGRAVNL